MTAPRVSRFDLELWSRMAKAAEEAARTEDAPTAFGIISALAAYLDAALTPAPVMIGDQQVPHDSTWDADYEASHEPGAAERLVGDYGDNLEKSLRRIFGR